MTASCPPQARHIRQVRGRYEPRDTPGTPWWVLPILLAAAISFCTCVLLLLLVRDARVALDALSRSSDAPPRRFGG